MAHATQSPQERKAEERRWVEIIYANRLEPGLSTLRKYLLAQFERQQANLLQCTPEMFQEHRALAVATKKILQLMEEIPVNSDR